MFGEMIDYYVLRPFTHNRNIATEDQLNSKANEPDIDLDFALSRVQKLEQRLEGRFPVRPGLRVSRCGMRQRRHYDCLGEAGSRECYRY